MIAPSTRRFEGSFELASGPLALLPAQHGRTESGAPVSDEARLSVGRKILRKLRYLVRINKDPVSDWGASVPDLPGCVATGKTIDSTLRRIQGAIQLHLRGMQADGVRPPRPRQRTVVPGKTSRQVDFYATVEVAA
jgi:predicted RNase H-like HicB family nuclease